MADQEESNNQETGNNLPEKSKLSFNSTDPFNNAINSEISTNNQSDFIDFNVITSLLKLIETSFNLVCFCNAFQAIFNCGDKWQSMPYSCGLFISGFFFIIYNFNLIHRGHKIISKINFIYCFVLGLFCLKSAIKFSQNSDLFPLFTIVLILLLTYIIDCYTTCVTNRGKFKDKNLSLAGKNIFNWHILSTNQLSIISDPQQTSNIKHECGKSFIKSYAGKIKIFILVLETISFILMGVASECGYFALMVTVLPAFILTVLFTFIRVLHLFIKSPKIWLIESIHSFMWSIVLLSSSCPLLNPAMSITATRIIILIMAITMVFLYAIDGSFKLRGYSRKREIDDAEALLPDKTTNGKEEKCAKI